MKKILIISPYAPWPLNAGGNVGVYYMLSYICKHADVSFITSYNRSNKYDKLKKLSEKLPDIKFMMYDYRKSENKKYEIIRKITKKIEESTKFGEGISKFMLNTTEQLTPGFINYINDYIKSEKIDIVQVEFLPYLPLIYTLPDNVKKHFVHHELGYVKNDLTYGDTLYERAYKNIMKDSEMAMCNRYDKIITLTETDAKKLSAEGVKTNIEISTLAISNKTLPFRLCKFENRLTFVGGSVHTPNYDGIKWFAKNVLPEVERNIENIKFDIIGNWSKEAIDEIKQINNKINFVGFVEDLNEAIKGSIMVVPINIGSGMRMKILEAANSSTPFISTIVGVEGLDFEDGKDCIISKDAESMSKAIIEVCKSAELYKKYAINSHDTFVKKYSYEELGRRRLSTYGINE